MARNIGPKNKKMRRFGMMESKKIGKYKKQKSVYGKSLEEKQKLKFIYGILERQMRNYAYKAMNAKANSEELLLLLLELRLDNVLYRLGFAKTRQQARQLVNHGHVKVNGKKIDIPSYSVKIGDEITLDGKFFDNSLFAFLNEKHELPSWLVRQGNSGKVVARPETSNLSPDIRINLVIAFYSK